MQTTSFAQESSSLHGCVTRFPVAAEIYLTGLWHAVSRTAPVDLLRLQLDWTYRYNAA